MRARARLNKNAVLMLLSSLVIGLCAFQYGDKYSLNSMPFAEVSRLSSDLAKVQKLAKQGNIEVLAGEAVPGKSVRFRGELTDANCLLSSHEHAYDHAFCAKLCVAAGSPLVFLSDQDGQIYYVLTAKNAVKIPASTLDKVGVPGTLVAGTLVSSNTVRALALEGIENPSTLTRHH